MSEKDIEQKHYKEMIECTRDFFKGCKFDFTESDRLDDRTNEMIEQSKGSKVLIGKGQKPRF